MKKDDPLNKLSVDDAILSMKVYGWSKEKVIEVAKNEKLEFNVDKFLERVSYEEKKSKKGNGSTRI